MLEQLLHYERDIFFALNGSNSIYLDHFMWLFSSKKVWFPLAFFILVVLSYKKNWKEILFVLLAITLVITLCDQFASTFCKPFFARFRPTSHPDFMNEVSTVFGYRSGRYGFISSHAANAFGFATFTLMLFRNKWYTYTILFWSIVTAYTRIYLGVHFISDVVCGAMAGIIFGFLVFKLYKLARQKMLGAACVDSEKIYSTGNKNAITIAIWVNVVLMLVFNFWLVGLIRS